MRIRGFREGTLVRSVSVAAYVDISVKYVGFPLFPVAQWMLTRPDSSFSSIDMFTLLLSLFYRCAGTKWFLACSLDILRLNRWSLKCSEIENFLRLNRIPQVETLLKFTF